MGTHVFCFHVPLHGRGTVHRDFILSIRRVVAVGFSLCFPLSVAECVDDMQNTSCFFHLLTADEEVSNDHRVDWRDLNGVVVERAGC